MTAKQAIDECIRIVLESPTYQQHVQICYCPMCSYIRGNVTEMRVLQKNLVVK